MYLNSTYVGLEPSIQVMNTIFVVLSLIGLILSLALTIISAIVETDYRLFVLNLAVIDVLYGFGRCLSGLLNLFPTYSGIWCQMDGFLFWYGKSASNMALFPTTVNRFIAVFVHDYFLKISSRRFALSLIVAVDLLVLLTLIPICFVYGRLGRAAVGADCSIQIDPEQKHKFLIFTAVYFVVVIPLSILQFIMNGVVYCAVSRHKNVLEVTRYDYKQTREIVLALLFQTASPVLIQWPFIAALGYELFDEAAVSVSNWLYYGTKDLHGIGPLVDSLLLFIMVKPYRRVLFFWISSCCPRLLKKKKIESAPVIDRSICPLADSFISRDIGVSVIAGDNRLNARTRAKLEIAEL
uniref:G-protein coupled receptors family 1 profile domain-containing protein n=1 Tax=Plectus sambesii TaxID=2011161 RepID=A0A914VMW6_9BILA